ncbi:MAG: hypothetical protein JOY68_07685 [Candidatus Dormibacteraeota bacterium]|nr:hypothetical protein [Candidatus Dormibacteraeota bacterium]
MLRSLAVAGLVAGALVALSGCSSSDSPASQPAATPVEHSGSCTVVKRATDASVTFDGTPDSAALKACQQVIDTSNGDFAYGAVVKNGVQLCVETVSVFGGQVTISVDDGDGLGTGNVLCATLAQYGSPVHS